MKGRNTWLSTDHGHEVAWLLELAVNPGQFDAVWALMEEMVASTRAEPGALGYAWFVGEENRTVALYERYADSAAVRGPHGHLRGAVRAALPGRHGPDPL